jgi:hypothetical protein
MCLQGATPTDPDVRHARIRFLRQSILLPLPQCNGGLVTRLVSAKSLVCRPTACSARRRLPSRGALGSHFPPFRGTLRRYDCHLSLSESFACRSFPDPLRASRCLWSPRRARGLVEAPRARQGLWSPGPPLRASRQGARGLSHVPACPLCRHAPLSDPGGVLRTRRNAPRTAAFQRMQPVGYPPRYPLRGSITRPASSLHPAPYGPLQGGTRVRY